MQPDHRQLVPASNRIAIAVAILGLAAGLTMGGTDARAQVTLQNDGWSSGQTVNFQSGFVSGEEGAVTLGPVSQGMLLDTVQFLFGGQTTAASVTLRIYEEVGTADPGAMLHQETLFITGSNEILQEVDVLVPQIYIPNGGSVRISLRFVHAGLPSIASDMDGTIQTGKNWIYAGGLGWVDAQVLGLTGDFIIRALANPSTGPGPDAGVDAGLDDGGVEDDGGANPDDGGAPDGGTDLDGGVSPDANASADGGVVPVECVESSVCEGGYACHRGECLLMCLDNDDCPDDRRCYQGVCVTPCEDSTDCDGGEVCEGSVCVTYCTDDEQCLDGEECSAFRCRTVVPSRKGCGCAATPDLRAIALPALLLLALLLFLARRLREP